MIRIKDLSFQRGTNGPQVLAGIDLSVAAGEIVCLLGPNGAGKSTLLNCLMRLLGGWQGRIAITGQDIRALSQRQLARLIAFVPQSTRTAFAFDVEQMVLMGRTARFGLMASPRPADRRAVHNALAAAGILHLHDHAFTELSGGEQQLVLVARALAQDAPVIILDEPAASLDLGNQGKILRLIRDLARAGRAVLMTTHVPDHVFILDGTAVLMKEGRVAATGAAADICSERAMTDLYGAPLRMISGKESRMTSYLPTLD